MTSLFKNKKKNTERKENEKFKFEPLEFEHFINGTQPNERNEDFAPKLVKDIARY